MGDLKVGRALRPDAQAFDEIRIITVPRYKTSGLSGDEWRISAAVQFYRKGRLVHEETGLRNVETAASFLPYLHAKACDDGKAYFAGEGATCDQEGCAEPATVLYRQRTTYCDRGHETDGTREYRQFCPRHSVRGDCGLDDSDANYERVAAPPVAT